MRAIVLLLVCAFVFVGCAGARASQTYNVDSSGAAVAGTRSAADAAPGVTGPQELAGLAIPFGNFMLKAALSWDGQPWFWTPAPATPSPSAMAAYAGCAPQTIQVQETYTEMVPVKRTRTVEKRVVTLPVPQAAAPCVVPAARQCPAPPPEPISHTSSFRECPCANGCCPAVTVAQR